MDAMTTMSGDATSFGQDIVQALTKSGQIWIAGCQTIEQAVAAATRSQIVHLMASWTAVSGARSFAQDSMAPVTACLTGAVGSFGCRSF